MAKNRLSLLVQ